MVSIFVGSGAGFARGSGATLGGSGVLGSAVQGRSGEGVSVNAATGNLLITQQDDFLVGRGPDSAVSRTYNSLAQVSDDNGDQWRFGSQRRLANWTGVANTAGATVDRVGEDGSVITYTYDVGLGYYRATDGAGAHDKIVNVGHWIWTDGDTQASEVYDIGGVLINTTDTDGNSLSFSYHMHNGSWRLSRATTSSGPGWRVAAAAIAQASAVPDDGARQKARDWPRRGSGGTGNWGALIRPRIVVERRRGVCRGGWPARMSASLGDHAALAGCRACGARNAHACYVHGTCGALPPAI